MIKKEIFVIFNSFCSRKTISKEIFESFINTGILELMIKEIQENKHIVQDSALVNSVLETIFEILNQGSELD